MSNIKDLTGQVFGELTVIRRVENYVSSGGHSFVQYECKCSCGNYKNVVGSKLKTKHVKSCGKCNAFSTFKDLTGKRFDKLTVVCMDGYYEYPNGERDYKWKCRCDCGNYVTIRGNSLKSIGNHCCKRCRNRTDRIKDSDMLNKKFGRLTVLSKAQSTYTKANTIIDWWNCRCDCGTRLSVRGASLRNGHTLSCGCYRAEMLSRSGYESKYEQFVKELFDKYGLNYSFQKTFCDLVGLGGNLLSYDFCVYKDDVCYLIELNGLQHYEPVDFFGGKKAFGKQKVHDFRKKQFAELNKYPLLSVCLVNTTTDNVRDMIIDFLNL